MSRLSLLEKKQNKEFSLWEKGSLKGLFFFCGQFLSLKHRFVKWLVTVKKVCICRTFVVALMVTLKILLV